MLDPDLMRKLKRFNRRIGRAEVKPPGSAAGSGVAALLVKAHTSADQSVAASTEDVIDFDTVDYDPGGDVTTGAAWHYTVPVTGWYAVGCESGLVSPNGVDWVVLDTAEIDVFVNGSFVQIIDYTTATIIDQGLLLSVNGQVIISVAATDTIDVRYANGSASTRTLLTPTYISIERVA